MSRIDEIRAREQAATHWPWSSFGTDYTRFEKWTVYDSYGKPVGSHMKKEDADLIANFRGDIHFLLNEVSRLAAQVEQKTREAEHWKVLRMDADRIREGLMDRGLRLISDKMRLEAELAGYREVEEDGPLSLEQLKQMIGEPIWCLRRPDHYSCGVVGEKQISEDEKRLVVGFAYGWEWIEDVIGCASGGIYAHKPR